MVCMRVDEMFCRVSLLEIRRRRECMLCSGNRQNLEFRVCFQTYFREVIYIIIEARVESIK